MNEHVKKIRKSKHFYTLRAKTARTTSMERRGGDEVNGAAAMNIEAEGPTLLSTTEVNRTFVFQQLRQTVEQLRGVGAIR